MPLLRVPSPACAFAGLQVVKQKRPSGQVATLPAPQPADLTAARVLAVLQVIAKRASRCATALDRSRLARSTRKRKTAQHTPLGPISGSRMPRCQRDRSVGRTRAQIRLRVPSRMVGKPQIHLKPKPPKTVHRKNYQVRSHSASAIKSAFGCACACVPAARCRVRLSTRRGIPRASMRRRCS